MSSTMRTAAIDPGMEDAEAPSLDCCNKYPNSTSPFPFPKLPVAYFHNFPNAPPPPHLLEVRSATECTANAYGLPLGSCARAS